MLQKPIFVVGHPRSGTSLMRALLERSEEVFTLGREGKPIWEQRLHPRHQDWHSNALDAADATDDLVAWLHTALVAGSRRPGVEWTTRAKLDYLEFLSAQGVNPYYYDVPFTALRGRFPGEPPEGPPTDPDGGELDEITPFCFPPLGAAPSEREMASGIRLVEKSIQSCFRLGFLQAAFPDARYVLVVRDPRTSIASLLEAWLHPRMFFSYRVPVELDIKGYSDRFPWGRHWWNLSLPPGWREWVSRPLHEVCAHSWRVHNEAILRDSEPLLKAEAAVVVRYEDLLADPAATMRRVADVVELPHAAQWTQAQLPTVMTQTTPDPDRWRRWQREIESVLPLVADVAGHFDYEVR